MRVPEPPKGIVARFLSSSARVDEAQLLQRRMMVPASDVGRGNRFPVSGTEQESGLASVNEFLQQDCDGRSTCILHILRQTHGNPLRSDYSLATAICKVVMN